MEAQDEEDEEENKAPAMLPFLRPKGRAGLATEAERSYATEAAKGTRRVGRRAASVPSP